jgi:hypothetical protein
MRKPPGKQSLPVQKSLFPGRRPHVRKRLKKLRDFTESAHKFPVSYTVINEFCNKRSRQIIQLSLNTSATGTVLTPIFSFPNLKKPGSSYWLSLVDCCLAAFLEPQL